MTLSGGAVALLAAGGLLREKIERFSCFGRFGSFSDVFGRFGTLVANVSATPVDHELEAAAVQHVAVGKADAVQCNSGDDKKKQQGLQRI